MSPFRRWAPVLAWAIVISIFSTHWFASESTSKVVEPIFHWLFPGASRQTLDLIHHIVRKCAHVFEYFIFSLLILRAIRGGRSGARLTWLLAAIVIVGAYASLDEYHQSFVPGRTAKVSDALLDTSAGILAQVLAALWIVRGDLRNQQAAAETSEPNSKLRDSR
ncbi:MAG: VanZ family protein [Candidatus Acidiferrales bacterium]